MHDFVLILMLDMIITVSTVQMAVVFVVCIHRWLLAVLLCCCRKEKMMMNETNISIQMNVNGVKKQFDGPSICPSD
jgi:hypothetical protein